MRLSEAVPGDSAARLLKSLNKSVADVGQVIFGQAGHLHDGIAVDAVFQHGTGNFKFTFLNTTLFTQLDALLNALLLKLLCDGHKCVSVLRHTLCQFAYKGFGVGCLACLHYIAVSYTHLTLPTNREV